MGMFGWPKSIFLTLSPSDYLKGAKNESQMSKSTLSRLIGQITPQTENYFSMVTLPNLHIYAYH